MKHTIIVPIQIEEQDIFNIFSTSNNFWVDHFEHKSEQYADNDFEKHKTIKLFCDYNLKGTSYSEKYNHNKIIGYELTIPKMLRGIELYITHGLTDMTHWFNDFGEWNETDSIGADIIVQLALFGEVIYG